MQSKNGGLELKYLVIIVLYNCRIEDSSTIRSLVEICKQFPANFTIAVWDNSIIPQCDNSLAVLSESFVDAHYCTDGKNTSLARVYNQLIDRFRGQFDFVNIWDQDSTFSSAYYLEFEDAVTKNIDLPLFVPLVYNATNVASPGRFSLYKGVAWKMAHTGRTPIKNFIAIASGILIKANFAALNKFDERLFIYGIDTKFFLDASKNTTSIYVLNYILRHEMSAYTPEQVEVKLFRFEDFCYSLLVICRDVSVISFIVSHFYLLYLAIKHSIFYKSALFLMAFIKSKKKLYYRCMQ